MAVPDVNATNPPPLKPAHLSDPVLAPFLQPSFDPAAYLNATLPPLSLSAQLPKQSVPSASATLADLSSHTQTLLSQLSTHTSRLSTVLSQLTDDILRSGARLAYEVDVLRGETIGLSELLTQGLQHHVRSFVPNGLVVTRLGDGASNTNSLEAPQQNSIEPTQDTAAAVGSMANADADTDAPPYIAQLRMLAQVRTRLESVIQVFGEAMQWTLPPSEISLASSLISVSGPEPGSDSHSREEKGREFAERLHNETADLITSSNQAHDGYDIAMARIQALRELAQVWKGTAEEKARIRFVEGLVKIAEDHHRARNKDATSRRQRDSRVSSPQPRADDRHRTEERSHGFLENLQRLRGGIYLE